MKTILSTLIAVGVLAGAAHAQSYDPFNDPRQALPRSSGYEQALPRTSNDDFRAALPRSASNDDHRQALPFTDEVFPDTTIAAP
jgi:hypothetical protein